MLKNVQRRYHIKSMKRKSIFERLTMSLSELENYYREWRKYQFEQGEKLKYIKLREKFYPFIVKLLVWDRFFRKQTIEIQGEHRKYQEQIIYACTHIGENDLKIYTSLFTEDAVCR